MIGCTSGASIDAKAKNVNRISSIFGSDRFAIKNAAAVGADVNAPENTRIARDATKARAVLMLIVVHARPGQAHVVRSPDRLDSVHCPDRENRRIIRSFGGFSET